MICHDVTAWQYAITFGALCTTIVVFLLWYYDRTR